MTIHKWLATLSHQLRPSSKQSNTCGYRFVVPPGKSLAICFEERDGKVEIYYPRKGNPIVSVQCSSTSDIERFEMGALDVAF